MASGDTARLYHRLSSYGPGRDYELAPIDHPLVVQDFVRMNLPTEPPRCKVYPDGLLRVELPRQWPAVDAPATAMLAGRPVAPPSRADGTAPIDLATLARLLHLSAGVVRTDVHRGRTMLFRAAGSAGGCFPIEIHVSARGVTGLPDGVYWFDPLNHALLKVAPAAGGEATTLVVTGVPWRTTWKYAERGFRHLYWDAGTMLAQTLAVAESSGLAPRLWTRFSDSAVARLVGADGIHEVPIALVGLASGTLAIEPTGIAALAIVDPRTQEFPLVTLAQRAGDADDLGDPWPSWPSVTIQPSPSADLDTVILKRGSARRMDPAATVSRELFDFALATALGGTRLPSFVVAHGVERVDPGIYRWPDLAHPIRRGDLREELLWVCWDMDLARDAAFVVLSAVDFASVDDRGYREAQIEAGLVEGRLHVAAYALGIGASGMSFLDSEIEALVGEPLAGLLFTCVGVPTYRNTAGGSPGRPVPVVTPASGETPARPPVRGNA